MGLALLQARDILPADLVPAGNVRPEVAESTDEGPIDPAIPLEGLVLQLRPSPENQAALEKAIRALHNPASPRFHQWFTPAEFAAGLAIPDSSLTAARSWLESEGLTVAGLSASRSAIYFSGSAARVQSAFHTSIHRVRTSEGQAHIANMTAPMMPARLASIVTGVVALHDFGPRHSGAASQLVGGDGGSDQNLGARDLQIIYSIDRVHAAGFSGQGQTVAVLETSDLYSAGDWLAYRRVFGLTKAFPEGQLQTVNPAGPYACTDPGAVEEEEEATLDAEVVTAAAPNATVIVAACQSTPGNDGLMIALENLLSSARPPQVISISYGAPEASLSVANRQQIEMLYMQSAAQGISIFVSVGDDGADANHSDYGIAGVNGISVNGRAATEWNVAVGGADFEDTYFGTVGDYWSPAGSATGQSALSYIPEIPWNGTCGSELLAGYNGFTQTFGATGFCNSSLAPAKYNDAGGGGQSACATGIPLLSGVIGGTCAGLPKPIWQHGVTGVPQDGVRDMPDLALFASNGAWRHAYAICFSDPARNSNDVPCTEHFVNNGGTSASTPLMAGIQILIDQATGQRWGNPDSIYYALAQSQYGSPDNTACDASLGNAIDGNCVFHDITQGDNVVACAAGTRNCYAPSGSVGVLSLSATTYEPAFQAAAGWDFATGLGSVNAANLLSHWQQGVTLSAVTPVQ